MSYSVYTTRGFILGSTPSGEASKIYYIYTEDFGLICAKAQSVRLLTSKLRFNLQEYSFGTFSLVRGKEIWRLIGVGDKVYRSDLVQMEARVLNLVKRLVFGEEKNSTLFEILVFMTQGIESRDHSDLLAFEHLILVHILSCLGYFDGKRILGDVYGVKLSLDSLGFIKTHKSTIVSEINKALHETQL